MKKVTVSQVIRRNIEEAIKQIEYFGYTAGKVRVKAFGGGDYRVWVEDTPWSASISSEDVKDGSEMEEMVRSFIEGAFDTLEPDNYSQSGRFRGGYHEYTSVYGDDEERLTANALHEIDCRMLNWESSEVDFFWNFDATDYVPERCGEIAGNLPLIVYHRKGKDWFVAAATEAFSSEVYYMDDYRELEYWGELEGEFTHNVTDEMVEAAEKLKTFIENVKDDLELKCIAKKFIRKASSMESFLDVDFDEDAMRDTAYEFCFKYYEENNASGWNHGFKGDFPDIENPETFAEFLKEFDPFKHQLELALKDSMHLYNLGQKLGFHAQFDLSGELNVPVEFVVGEEEFSVHVDANEFEECDRNWKQVLREVVMPQVARRRFLAKQEALKRKIGSSLKEYASKLWVRFQDSIDAGNCRFGSMEFVNKHHIDLEKSGAIRGDLLLEMEDSTFTQRIIYSLAMKHSKELGLA